MKDHLGLDNAKATITVADGVLIYTVVLVIIGQAAGYVSDRLGRRKFLVFLSTALFAVGLGLLTQARSISAFSMVEAILGAAYGIYMGVDPALALAVLPHPEDNAKDLGVFNIATRCRRPWRRSSAPPCCRWAPAGRTTTCCTSAPRC